MNSLNVIQLENTIGGDTCDTAAWISGVACGVSLAWPIGTLIAGPTCVGMGVGAAACHATR